MIISIKTDGPRVVSLFLLSVFVFCGCGQTHRKGEQPENVSTADFEYAVDDLERNYSGFQFKINDGNKDEYAALKAALKQQILDGTVPEYEAIAMLFGFFQDRHLQTYDRGHEKYRKPSVNYSRKMKYAPDTLAAQVSSKTFLIRYPTCNDQIVGIDWTNRSVAAFLDSGCENLILDIRGNGGGSDYVYTPYLLLLYDHPGETEGVFFYDTEANRKQMEEYFPGMYEVTPLSKEEGPSNELVPFGDYPIVFDKESSPLPRKAVIIIDNGVASSGEQLVIDLKSCSDRVVVYGRDNTNGCLDFSNCRLVELPESGNYYQMPMTVSQRVLDGRGIDESGIAPDVRVHWRLPRELSDNIDHWVIKIAKELDKE